MDAQAVLIRQRAVTLADGRALGAQLQHETPELVDAGDGQAGSVAPGPGPGVCPARRRHRSRRPGRGAEDPPGRASARPGGRDRQIALQTQPARQLGDGRPGPAQGHEFMCVPVGLRPALAQVRSSERMARVVLAKRAAGRCGQTPVPRDGVVWSQTPRRGFRRIVRPAPTLRTLRLSGGFVYGKEMANDRFDT